MPCICLYYRLYWPSVFMPILETSEAILYVSVKEFLVSSCNSIYVPNGTMHSVELLTELAVTHRTYT